MNPNPGRPPQKRKDQRRKRQTTQKREKTVEGYVNKKSLASGSLRRGVTLAVLEASVILNI